jgi:hypothetical protein
VTALRISVFVVVLVGVSSRPAAAFAVYDASAWVEHVLSESIQKLTHTKQMLVDDGLRRAARRGWMFIDTLRYKLVGQPLYRTRRLDIILPGPEAFFDAVNGGDLDGTMVDRALVPLLQEDRAELPDALRADRATVELADSALKASISFIGADRGNRKELRRAIPEFEADALSSRGSATSVADVALAGRLLLLRQHQQQAGYLATVDDLLLVETKRARDVMARDFLLRSRQGTVTVTDGSTDAFAGWRLP